MLGAGDKVAAEHVVKRRQRHGGVVDNLDGGAAGAEQDDRAEHRIMRNPDDRFASTRAPDHGLHAEAIENALRIVRSKTLGDAVCGGARLGRRLDIEDDAADVGFVADLARQHLDDQRRRVCEQVARVTLDRIEIGRDPGFGDRNAVGGDDGLGLGLGEQAAPFPGDCGKYGAHDIALAGNVLAARFRHTFERMLGARPAADVVERIDGIVRHRKAGNAGGAQQRPSRFAGAAAEPTGQQRLAFDAAFGWPAPPPRGRRRSGRQGRSDSS